MTSRMDRDELGVPGHDGDRVGQMVAYIDQEAARDHPWVFGGSSTHNQELQQYTPARPHLALLQDLHWAMPEPFRPRFQLALLDQNGTSNSEASSEWETLSKDMLDLQDDFEASKEGGFWGKIWYNLGSAKDAVDPWIALIPNEWGLAVVKMGVAVLLKIAENSKTKKDKIVATFTALRDIIANSRPTKFGFSDDPQVRKHADELYQAVVDSIRDMLRLTTAKKAGFEVPKKVQELFGKKYKPRPPPPKDADAILEDVKSQAVKFQQSVAIARDNAIQRTDWNVQVTSVRLGFLSESAETTKKNTEQIITGVDDVRNGLNKGNTELTILRQKNEQAWQEQRQARDKDRQAWQRIDDRISLLLAAEEARQKADKIAASVGMSTEQGQVDSKNQLLSILKDRDRNKRELAATQREKEAIQRENQAIQTENAVIQQENDAKDRLIAKLRAAASPRPPLLSPDEFWALLAGRRERAAFSAQANLELERVLLYRNRLQRRAQGQANSVLSHAGFRGWLASPGPALLLVNCNLPGAERTSAASVFSATLVTSLVSARPGAVVVHFFCGLHTNLADLEYGPNGMLRSVVMQLVLKLVERRRLDLGFLSRDQDLAELRSADPRTACNALCQALYDLVGQFPATTEVYLIVDSISFLDREKILPLLRIVVGCFQELVEDDGLAPVCKVFLTHVGHASPIKIMDAFKRPGRQINLSSSNSTPASLSPRAMGRQILRSSTPTPGTLRRGMSRLASGDGYDDDEHDQGFETE